MDLPLAVRERQFDGRRVGGVDHHRRLHLANQLFVKRLNIFFLVAFRALQAYIHDVRPAAHLPPRYFAGLFPLFFRDQILEQSRANYVGPFAHQQRPRLIVRLNRLDSRVNRAVRFAPVALAASCLPPSAQSRGCVFPSSRSTRRRNSASRGRRISPVAPPASSAFPGICLLHPAVQRSDSTTQIRIGELAQRSNVVRHELRPGRAIHPKRQRLAHAAAMPTCASTVCPASIVPIGSIVTDTMNGTAAPISLRKFLNRQNARP